MCIYIYIHTLNDNSNSTVYYYLCMSPRTPRYSGHCDVGRLSCDYLLFSAAPNRYSGEIPVNIR